MKDGGECGELERILTNEKIAAAVHHHPIVTCEDVGSFKYVRYFVKSPNLKTLT